MLSNGDFEHLDPGEAYYALDYAVVYATNRPLFSYPPNSRDDGAAGPGHGDPDDVQRRDHRRRQDGHDAHPSGVHFSPPVNRAVTSKDVAFAMERGANPNVGNAYWPAYFGASSPAPIVGSTNPKYKGGPLPGHPDAEQFDDRVPPDEAGRADADRRAQPAAVGAAAGVVRGAAGQARPDDLRHDVPGRRPGRTWSRPTRRARSRASATSPARPTRWCATRTGIRRRTTGPPT